jgi:predicted alpha/beta-hydrolase family hydrolase
MSFPITLEVFTDVTVDPFVRGLLHHPANANGDALLLTHGAGGNCNAPLLIALAEVFADTGCLVLRCDLPFRQYRPYGPPGPFDAKRDRAGLLLLSYPLHPPRKPQQLRTQHFPDLRTPALFVHGTRDPFGSIAEFGGSLKLIPAKTKLVAIEGAGHDLGFKGKTRSVEVPKLVLSEFQGFFK